MEIIYKQLFHCRIKFAKVNPVQQRRCGYQVRSLEPEHLTTNTLGEFQAPKLQFDGSKFETLHHNHPHEIESCHYEHSIAMYDYVSAHQYNETHRLVMLTDNFCVVMTSFQHMTMTPFAGECSSLGYRDGYGDEARFSRIYHSVRADDQQSVIIADHDNHKLRYLGLFSKRVSTFASLTKKPIGLVMRPESDELFFSFPGGLGRLNPLTPHLAEYLTSHDGYFGHSDGHLSAALFSDMPATLLFISTNVMLVSDYNNDVLRAVDTEKSTVTTLCTRGEPAMGGKSIKRCALKNPQSLLHKETADGKQQVLIGMSGAIGYLNYYGELSHKSR